MDYNRVNLEIFEGGIGLERESDYGSYFQIKFDLETTRIVLSGSNFLETIDTALLGKRFYFGVPNITYAYQNTDKMDSPAKGMDFSIKVGAIDNFNSSDLTGFAKSHLIFYNSLTTTGRLVFKSGVMGHLNVGDDLPFFQSPHLGGDYGLRGYRNQRFTGDNSFAAAADVIYNFEKLKTFLFPMDISIYGGMDSGRVWIKNESSTVWHNSYGGGLMIKWTEAIKGNVSMFHSKEGNRVQFGFRVAY